MRLGGKNGLKKFTKKLNSIVTLELFSG